MGDTSDWILEGDMCAYCTTAWFTSHGFPTLCDNCWDKSTEEQRSGYQKATHKEY